jgi:hypothetical protein
VHLLVKRILYESGFELHIKFGCTAWLKPKLNSSNHFRYNFPTRTQLKVNLCSNSKNNLADALFLPYIYICFTHWTRCSEMLVNFYQTTRRHIEEYFNLHIHRCQNFESRTNIGYMNSYECWSFAFYLSSNWTWIHISPQNLSVLYVEMLPKFVVSI